MLCDRTYDEELEDKNDKSFTVKEEYEDDVYNKQMQGNYARNNNVLQNV